MRAAACLGSCPPRPPSRCPVLGVDPSLGRSPWGVALAEPDGGAWRLTVAWQGAMEESLRRLAGLAGRACLCAVDAPLTLQPPGGLRACERAAQRLGARLLPGYPAMRRLTTIASIVARACSEAGAAPLEVHPSSAALVLGLPTPGSYGGKRHLAEATMASAVAALYVEGLAIAASSRECCVALPVRGARAHYVARSLLSGLSGASPS